MHRKKFNPVILTCWPNFLIGWKKLIFLTFVIMTFHPRCQINWFLKKKMNSGNGVNDCSYILVFCRCHRRGTEKELQIAAAPKTLIVNLKRFEHHMIISFFNLHNIEECSRRQLQYCQVKSHKSLKIDQNCYRLEWQYNFCDLLCTRRYHRYIK